MSITEIETERGKRSIDWSKINRLKKPLSGVRKREVRINDRKEIIFSSVLRDELKDQEGNINIEFYYTDDYKTLVLKRGGDDALRFTKSGRMKNACFAQGFLDAKYKVPGVYTMYWDKNNTICIGDLQEVPEAPVMQLKRKRK